MILYWGKCFASGGGGGSVKVFESDLLENVQVVATKAGHLSEYNLNPFAPEPPVTARADPGPFYPL